MKLIVVILLILSAALCRAQNCDSNLFGANYTYVEFVISKKQEYPIFFAAVTKNDSIKVELCNVDTFITSIYSSCDNVPISNSAYLKGYELVFGKSEQTYNTCSLFISDFIDKFDRLQQKTELILDTGEHVQIRYFNLIGIFLKLDEKYKSISVTSIGLAKENIPKNTIIPISIIDYYQSNYKLCLY